jgi:hypothetical protein
VALPHLFLIDRDERNDADIEKLKRNEKLQGRLHVFERREMENYLLVPAALERYIKDQKNGNATDLEKRNATTSAQIEALIRDARDGLKSQTIAKWVSACLHREHRVFIVARDDIGDLETALTDAKYAQKAKALVKKKLLEQAKLDAIPELVKRERKLFEKLWADEAKRINIAPGEEILCAVLKHFSIGTKDIKQKVPKIAAYLEPDDIVPELKELIERIYELPKR